MLLLAFASYFTSDFLWSAFFTSKRQKPSHHVKVAVHGEDLCITYWNLNIHMCEFRLFIFVGDR
jgi:hypothetical protein